MDKKKEIFTKDKNIDPRRNDAWRILLFALNSSGGLSIMHMMGKISYFSQNVLQIGVFFATLILPMTLLDAITDPLIATWFDKFESKHGKFRPFMITGGLMSFIPAMIIFCYPVNSSLPLWATYLILGICYAIIVIGNTILSTATRAGQAIITQDPKQRPIFALGKTVFDAVVMIFVSVMVTSGLFGSMQNPFVWRTSVIILSFLSIPLILIAMHAIKTRDTPRYYSITNTEEKLRFTEFFKVFMRNEPLRRLVIATGSDSLAASVRATLSIYLFANILMNRGLSSAFDIVTDIILGAPVLIVGIFLASKKGSAEVYTKISIFQIIIAISGFAFCLIFLPPDSEYMYTGFTIKVIGIFLIFGLYMSTLGISSNLVNSLTGDLADYEFYQSGKFIPGTIGAVLTFFSKLVSSVVGVLTTGIMLFCGFGGFGENAVVPENVFVNNRFYYCILLSIFVLPAIGHLITYLES